MNIIDRDLTLHGISDVEWEDSSPCIELEDVEVEIEVSSGYSSDSVTLSIPEVTHHLDLDCAGFEVASVDVPITAILDLLAGDTESLADAADLVTALVGRLRDKHPDALFTTTPVSGADTVTVGRTEWEQAREALAQVKALGGLLDLIKTSEA